MAGRDWRPLIDEAVELARRGVLEVEPNPPVGALVVQGDEIVGRGFHPYFGGPHAEVAALREAGRRARGATLVCTLEPCSSWGKTPPCVDMLLRAGIERVVVGTIDPFPEHRGEGIERLRAAGVDVVAPIERELCDALLERFKRHLERRRPWIVAKWAMSLDGRSATRTRRSKWISGDASRRRVAELRGRVDAVAVGVDTVIEDDPGLVAGAEGPLRALRVVFDRRLRCPEGWRALHDEGPQVVIVHTEAAAPERRAALAALGARCLEAPGGGAFLSEGLRRLRSELNVQRLLLEGGARILGAFADEGLIDQVQVHVAPLLLGGAEAPGAVAGRGVDEIAEGWSFDEGRWEQVGADAVFRGFVRRR